MRTRLGSITVIAATSLATALSLGALTAAPSYAGQEATRDAARDVVVVDGSTQEAAPGNRSSDITRFETRLGPRRLTLGTTLRALPRGEVRVLWQAQTARGLYTVALADAPGARSFTLTRGGRTITCPAKTRAVDRTTRTYTVTVPTSCLAGATWVRTGAGVAAAVGDSFSTYVDDARLRGRIESSSLALGPRVRA